jgi:hypothetical protein
LVTLTRYVAAASVDGTSTMIVVFVKELTVLDAPPTVTVGATPFGLKFEPDRIMAPLDKLTAAPSIAGVCAWLASGAIRISSRMDNRPADVVSKLQRFVESSNSSG